MDADLRQQEEVCGSCKVCRDMFSSAAVEGAVAVGSPLVMDPTSICRKARRLAGRQAELCQAEPEVVAELARGARLGVRECQFQFRFRRWNCSSHSKAFGRILQQGREDKPLDSGSQAVRSHTRTECKCHGLSGSCALRTCWQKLPPFREVGARLLERFHGASRVMGTNDGKALLPAVRTLKPPGRADLLYAADSPDFCAPNRRTGSPGTRGRACNSSALDLSGCDLLCCGRGHRQESVQLEENCLCRFHWCCVVQCHRCRVRKELSLCL
ncbi:protein Wnt-6 [Puma concolor]|uniref:Protein Wnt n=1 Tax=Puma concolor TaxID=9696 RepID=A0A6P6ICE7_PUMCO|nr:protein Wnt-6 [Puma concolor]